MSPTAWWQFRILKETARDCLLNYRRSHDAFYLTRADEYIHAALAMFRGLR